MSTTQGLGSVQLPDDTAAYLLAVKIIGDFARTAGPLRLVTTGSTRPSAEEWFTQSWRPSDPVAQADSPGATVAAAAAASSASSVGERQQLALGAGTVHAIELAVSRACRASFSAAARRHLARRALETAERLYSPVASSPGDRGHLLHGIALAHISSRTAQVLAVLDDAVTEAAASEVGITPAGLGTTAGPTPSTKAPPNDPADGPQACRLSAATPALLDGVLESAASVSDFTIRALLEEALREVDRSLNLEPLPLRGDDQGPGGAGHLSSTPGSMSNSPSRSSLSSFSRSGSSSTLMMAAAGSTKIMSAASSLGGSMGRAARAAIASPLRPIRAGFSSRSGPGTESAPTSPTEAAAAAASDFGPGAQLSHDFGLMDRTAGESASADARVCRVVALLNNLAVIVASTSGQADWLTTASDPRRSSRWVRRLLMLPVSTGDMGDAPGSDVAPHTSAPPTPAPSTGSMYCPPAAALGLWQRARAMARSQVSSPALSAWLTASLDNNMQFLSQQSPYLWAGAAGRADALPAGLRARLLPLEGSPDHSALRACYHRLRQLARAAPRDLLGPVAEEALLGDGAPAEGQSTSGFRWLGARFSRLCRALGTSPTTALFVGCAPAIDVNGIGLGQLLCHFELGLVACLLGEDLLLGLDHLAVCLLRLGDFAAGLLHAPPTLRDAPAPVGAHAAAEAALLGGHAGASFPGAGTGRRWLSAVRILGHRAYAAASGLAATDVSSQNFQTPTGPGLHPEFAGLWTGPWAVARRVHLARAAVLAAPGLFAPEQQPPSPGPQSGHHPPAGQQLYHPSGPGSRSGGGSLRDEIRALFDADAPLSPLALAELLHDLAVSSWGPDLATCWSQLHSGGSDGNPAPGGTPGAGGATAWLGPLLARARAAHILAPAAMVFLGIIPAASLEAVWTRADSGLATAGATTAVANPRAAAAATGLTLPGAGSRGGLPARAGDLPDGGVTMLDALRASAAVARSLAGPGMAPGAGSLLLGPGSGPFGKRSSRAQRPLPTQVQAALLPLSHLPMWSSSMIIGRNSISAAVAAPGVQIAQLMAEQQGLLSPDGTAPGTSSGAGAASGPGSGPGASSSNLLSTVASVAGAAAMSAASQAASYVLAQATGVVYDADIAAASSTVYIDPELSKFCTLLPAHRAQAALPPPRGPAAGAEPLASIDVSPASRRAAAPGGGPGSGPMSPAPSSAVGALLSPGAARIFQSDEDLQFLWAPDAEVPGPGGLPDGDHAAAMVDMEVPLDAAMVAGLFEQVVERALTARPILSSGLAVDGYRIRFAEDAEVRAPGYALAEAAVALTRETLCARAGTSGDMLSPGGSAGVDVTPALSSVDLARLGVSLADIPEIFFAEDFDLTDPDTFNQILTLLGVDDLWEPVDADAPASGPLSGRFATPAPSNSTLSAYVARTPRALDSCTLEDMTLPVGLGLLHGRLRGHLRTVDAMLTVALCRHEGALSHAAFHPEGHLASVQVELEAATGALTRAQRQLAQARSVTITAPEQTLALAARRSVSAQTLRLAHAAGFLRALAAFARGALADGAFELARLALSYADQVLRTSNVFIPGQEKVLFLLLESLAASATPGAGSISPTASLVPLADPKLTGRLRELTAFADDDLNLSAVAPRASTSGSPATRHPQPLTRSQMAELFPELACVRDITADLGERREELEAALGQQLRSYICSLVLETDASLPGSVDLLQQERFAPPTDSSARLGAELRFTSRCPLHVTELFETAAHQDRERGVFSQQLTDRSIAAGSVGVIADCLVSFSKLFRRSLTADARQIIARHLTRISQEDALEQSPPLGAGPGAGAHGGGVADPADAALEAGFSATMADRLKDATDATFLDILAETLGRLAAAVERMFLGHLFFVRAAALHLGYDEARVDRPLHLRESLLAEGGTPGSEPAPVAWSPASTAQALLRQAPGLTADPLTNSWVDRSLSLTLGALDAAVSRALQLLQLRQAALQRRAVSSLGDFFRQHRLVANFCDRLLWLSSAPGDVTADGPAPSGTLVPAPAALVSTNRLRAALSAHERLHFQNIHQTRRAAIEGLVSTERWAVCDVPREFQALVDQITARPGRGLFAQLPGLSEGQPATEVAVAATPAPASGGSADGPPADDDPEMSFDSLSASHSTGQSPSVPLSIQSSGETFYAVPALLMTIRYLHEYLQTFYVIETGLLETTSRAANLISTFDQAASQAVLNSGAMKSAGLQKITINELALSHNAISILVCLCTAIQEHLLFLLTNPIRGPTSQGAGAGDRRRDNLAEALAAQFEPVHRKLRQHRANLEEKMVSVLDVRAQLHFRNLRMELVSGPGARRADAARGPSEHAKRLVKELTTLRRVLIRYIRQPSLLAKLLEMAGQSIAARFHTELLALLTADATQQGGAVGSPMPGAPLGGGSGASGPGAGPGGVAALTASQLALLRQDASLNALTTDAEYIQTCFSRFGILAVLAETLPSSPRPGRGGGPGDSPAVRAPPSVPPSAPPSLPSSTVASPFLGPGVAGAGPQASPSTSRLRDAGAFLFSMAMGKRQ
ncbi:hypothetical protein H696_02582 [Fonticula alba]|uniref:Vacuolar protein sorting-associated protein 54 C-terminal domain-containing protein n=1 Tax=Fonticula alba TaxID=691883 RepID=A0A058Z9P2_FONAL|nr:hypothetical protein H696_02582 [Fonticula alba]KCV70252.1 hypothetical protein H696_02582 [Fonticula alba]|eukprot:XP_009494768.1 hypothetical protein H696_02582 [Fonticula alba]